MSEQGPDPQPNTRSGRGRTILLYVSLALNLLVVGVVVGAVLFGGRPASRAIVDGPFPLLRALSETERRELVHELRQSGRTEQRERPVVSLQRSRELLRIIREPEFDAAKFDQVLGAQMRAVSQRMDATRSALTNVLTEMSFDERQAYAERLEMSLRKSFRDRRPPGSDREGPR